MIRNLWGVRFDWHNGIVRLDRHRHDVFRDAGFFFRAGIDSNINTVRGCGCCR